MSILATSQNSLCPPRRSLCLRNGRNQHWPENTSPRIELAGQVTALATAFFGGRVVPLLPTHTALGPLPPPEGEMVAKISYYNGLQERITHSPGTAFFTRSLNMQSAQERGAERPSEYKIRRSDSRSDPLPVRSTPSSSKTSRNPP